jgi:hypothetical protein
MAQAAQAVAVDTAPLYDIVVPYHLKDRSILPHCIRSLRRFAVAAGTIYIVSAVKPDERLFEAVPDTKWICETAYPMTLDDVQAILQSTKGRQGWYYQQLLKLYCFQAIPGLRPNVVLFDADVVLYSPIEFVCPRTGKLQLDWKYQYNHPYFRHAEALLGDKFRCIRRGVSGIADHIVTSREIVSSLLQAIESQYPGLPAWKTMLELVDPRDVNGSGFSEYELLFNWSFLWFPQKVEARKLIWGLELDVFHHYLQKKPKVKKAPLG